MECVFEITLNLPLDAYECLAYTGHWCEWCGEDNGGGKFCYKCGQRETEEEEEEGGSVFASLLANCEEEEEEQEEEEEVCECSFPKFVIKNGLQTCRCCGLLDHYKKGIIAEWSDDEN